MSTGLECWIFENENRQWFYALQSWTCPVGAWDWTEENPLVVGPFVSEDAAHKHLSDHEANPGGYNTYPHNPSDERQATKLSALAAKARSPRR